MSKKWVAFNEKKATSMWLAYWALRVKRNGPTQVKEPLSPCSPAPLSTDVNHQGSGKRIKGKVLQGIASFGSNQRQKKKHEQGCLQSAPGDSLGPQYSMVRPELGAASESSGVLSQHDLTSLREGQNSVSSSPPTVDDSTWLSCFKRWAISKAVSTGFPKLC